MSEWQRLTPEDDPLGSRYCAVTSLYNGDWLLAVARIKEGKLEPRNNKHAFCLSPAELTALVRITGAWREVPEVRALVMRVREMFKVLDEVYRDDPAWSVTAWLEEEPTATAAWQALAPFEEAAGG